MRVLIDACVFYPTVVNCLVLGLGEAGGFAPLWSPRILEEWALAAAREGPVSEAAVRGEIAALRARFPGAEIAPDPGVEAGLHLPDPDDAHVLAAAIAGQAEALLTFNTRDFPLRALAAHGILRRHPDEFLLEAHAALPGRVERLVAAVEADIAATGAGLSRRGLLKKARLPRLAKALASSG
ncbi:MAG: PIN domain-containing protein [Paracoccaceae bacterium]|nr:PIN domain-containing protein [Paracoccaceae bacterium]